MTGAMTLKRLTPAAFATVAAGAALASLLAVSPASARPAVVELFTSQGCSSCPPADALINEVAPRTDVIALTYNITYWDYLGWRDTLGRDEHTARQEAYAHQFRDRKYTPQLVVDGASHLPGSRVSKSRRTIDEQAASVADSPALTTSITADGLALNAAAAGDGIAAVWLVQYDTAHEVEITRGENAGETITYSNVVREITRLEDWDMSQPLSLAVEKDLLLDGMHDGCAVIVQRAGDYGVGDVITAARIDMSLIN
jgi:hypothetical protein